MSTLKKMSNRKAVKRVLSLLLAVAIFASMFVAMPLSVAAAKTSSTTSKTSGGSTTSGGKDAFQNLDKVGESAGNIVREGILWLQRWIWIPLVISLVLAFIAFIGSRRGKEWATDKLRNVLIAIFGIFFIVSIATAIISAFAGGNSDTITKMQESLNF